MPLSAAGAAGPKVFPLGATCRPSGSRKAGARDAVSRGIVTPKSTRCGMNGAMSDRTHAGHDWLFKPQAQTWPGALHHQWPVGSTRPDRGHDADDAVRSAPGDRWTVRCAQPHAGVKTAGGTKSRSRPPLTLEADGRTAVLNAPEGVAGGTPYRRTMTHDVVQVRLRKANNDS